MSKCTYYPLAGKAQRYAFSNDKNRQLIEQRGISFEEIITAIEEGAVLTILPHPNQSKYPDQEVYLININDYIYMVPHLWEDKNTIFLKTAFAHRKLTKKYLRGPGK